MTRMSLILNIACRKAREHDVCALCVCVACVCGGGLSVLGVVIGVVACSWFQVCMPILALQITKGRAGFKHSE